MELEGLVVVDLRGFRETPLVASAVVYRVLSRLFEARDEELAKDASPPPMSVDEVTTSHRRAPGRTLTRRPWQTTGEDGRILRHPQPRRPQRLGDPAHQHRLEGRKVLERLDMAEYAGAYA